MQKRNLKKTTFIFAISICFCGILLMTAGCDSSKPSGGGGTLDHNGMLNSLGVNTDIGERKNPAGNPVQADYNPTMRKTTQLVKRSEIFLAGIREVRGNASWTAGGKSHALLDWPDNGSDFSAGAVSGDDSWENRPKATASGDLDGDGADEILVAYLGDTMTGFMEYSPTLAFVVIKHNSGVYSAVHQGTIATFTPDQITEYESKEELWRVFDWMNNFNAVCGDADGNGQSETLISFNGDIFLIGDLNKGYGLLQSVSYQDSDGSTFLMISAGDLDNDGTDEFVVVENNLHRPTHPDGNATTAFCHIYKGLTLGQIPGLNDRKDLTATCDSGTVTLRLSNCAVGDLDADGLNEVLFVGYPRSGAGDAANRYMMILDQSWNDATGRFEFSLAHLGSRLNLGLRFGVPYCAVADFDGDGKKEFIGGDVMYENISETGGNFEYREHIFTDVIEPNLIVGDFDGDAKADIVRFGESNLDEYDVFELCCYGYNAAGEWVRKGTSNYFNIQNYICFTMGDFDGDSITVAFEGSELLFSDPHPIAVLAANPYWKGLEMERGETAFGTSKSGSVQEEKKIGFSTGFSIGYEYEAPFVNSGASVKASFESSFDWTSAESKTIKESHTYTTFDEDKVIFTTTPYDVFYYRVIQAPDDEMLDTVMAVNLPRKPITLAVERGFYNANNGGAPDIDRAVLAHTLGDPFSYPTPKEADQLISAGGGQGVKSSSMEALGQGQTTTEIEMSVENTEAKGTAFDFEVKIEATAKVLGVTAGRSAGFGYGESYKLSTTKGTLYRGKVGGVLKGGFTSDRFFTWGLFSYKTVLDDEEFIVVNYYTDKVVGKDL